MLKDLHFLVSSDWYRYNCLHLGYREAQEPWPDLVRHPPKVSSLGFKFP